MVEKFVEEENLNLDDDTIFKMIQHIKDIRKLICLLEYYSKNNSINIEDFLKSVEKKYSC